MSSNAMTRIASTGIAALLAATAHAQVVSCGFDTPTYSIGQLDGQHGWAATTDPGAAMVVAQPRRAGTGAAIFNMGMATYDVLADWPVSVALGAADSVIDVDWDYYYQFGDGFGWNIQLRAGDGASLGWLWIDGGNMWFKARGAEPLQVGVYLTDRTWGHFRVSIDWSTHVSTLYVNGQEGATAVFATGSRAIAHFELSSVMGGYTDICGLDEVSVAVRHVCTADFNADGAVDFFDYLDFVDAFAAGAFTADFNHDSTVDFFDYLDFVDALATGC